MLPAPKDYYFSVLMSIRLRQEYYHKNNVTHKPQFEEFGETLIINVRNFCAS